MKPPTSDQIRDAIDRGMTGEKVDFPDPAAAPLGTDDEAGGRSPTPEERAIEARALQSQAKDTHRPRKLSLVTVALLVFVVLGIILFAIVRNASA